MFGFIRNSSRYCIIVFLIVLSFCAITDSDGRKFDQHVKRGVWGRRRALFERSIDLADVDHEQENGKKQGEEKELLDENPRFRFTETTHDAEHESNVIGLGIGEISRIGITDGFFLSSSGTSHLDREELSSESSNYDEDEDYISDYSVNVDVSAEKLHISVEREDTNLSVDVDLHHVHHGQKIDVEVDTISNNVALNERWSFVPGTKTGDPCECKVIDTGCEVGSFSSEIECLTSVASDHLCTIEEGVITLEDCKRAVDKIDSLPSYECRLLCKVCWNGKQVVYL